MDKLISVINDNLRSIISGIKINAADIEKNLNDVSNKMDDLISVAGTYKEDVEHSRKNIEALEGEITQLESDLDELQIKFGSRDFEELLAAGNKEISTKIIEKRAFISKESDKILELTEKAHKLKEELISLKEQKANLEQSLEEANIVKKYYDARINEIIDYADEHVTDLAKYIEETPSDRLMSDDSLDSEVIGTNVDGSVFEEIDSISSSEPSIDLIEQAMNSTRELKDIDEKEDLSMTKQLDDIILAANEVLAETKNIKDDYSSLEINKNDANSSNKIDTNFYDDEEKENEIEKIEIEDKEENVEDEILPFKEPSKDSLFEENPILDNIYDNEEESDDVLSIDLDSIAKDAQEIDKEDYGLENLLNSELEIDPLEFNKFNTNDVVTSDLETTLNKYGIDKYKFKNIDILENNFNSKNFDDIMEVLKKHSIKMDSLYNATGVLANVTPANLDKILTILEGSGAVTDDIEMVFSYLDKIDMNELERASYGEDKSLSNMLFSSMSVDSHDEIVSALSLDAIESGILKANCKGQEYDKICLFSDIVVKNYNTLSSYKVDNAKECFVKHPHRFLLNPTVFSEILDKYDSEDLVRCINKNLAVIDRL